ncbi:MAG: tRNA (adenosine(37)-N6)-dimethylallyltransferase MiaA [Bacteroidales bacterium]|jgi:tRNA dimethylallyltransferase
MQKYLIVICGPTGIGKTKIAVEIAKAFDCEIVSADSRQLFREMRIGTAVPSEEDLGSVPHHFVRSHSIHQNYNASLFEEEVLAFLNNYYAEKDTAVLAGGSGLYIHAVCEGIDELPSIDPEIRTRWQRTHEEKGTEFLLARIAEIDPQYLHKADKKNPKRLLKAIEVYEMTGRPYSSFLNKQKKHRSFHTLRIGINTSRELLYKQINERVENMLREGLVDEARELHPYRDLTPLNTVGYKELFDYFEGKISLEEAKEQIKNHSRAYARRQLTWFRQNRSVRWFEPGDVQKIKEYISEVIR